MKATSVDFMNLLYIVFCWFACQSGLAALSLWQIYHNDNWLHDAPSTTRYNSLAFLALIAGILWGVLVLKLGKIPQNMFWGCVIAYLIHLWIKDKHCYRVLFISNTFMIATCLLLYALFFELIYAGPYSNHFGIERQAVFKPGNSPELPSIGDFECFGESLGRASECGLPNSEVIVSLRRMNRGLSETLESGGITETHHDEITSNMMNEMNKAVQAQDWYFDKISCGKVIVKWKKMKKILPF